MSTRGINGNFPAISYPPGSRAPRCGHFIGIPERKMVAIIRFRPHQGVGEDVNEASLRRTW